MKYILDISSLDQYSSGAKQRFLSLYHELIKTNKNKNFLLIYSNFYNIKKKFNYSNVFFYKNPFSQESYIKKSISVIYLFFYIKLKLKRVKAIEYFTLPFFKIKNCKIIFTIHDVRRIYFSNFFISKFILKFFYKFFLRKTDSIIVVSKAIKNEISKYFDNLNISIIYNTIDKSFFNKISINDVNKIKKKYNLTNNFIFTVGHQEKRKNFLRLIYAIYILKNDFPSIKLVIAGQKADETKKIKNLIIKLRLSNNIKVFSNLNDFEVRCFYKLAKLFVFPSIYEGFGIPLLEAMASGLPMVLSNTEVFREITENKYSYFDHYDSLSIANRIKFILLNKSIQKQMILYGKKRVNNFTLNVQRKTINNFYNKIL